MRKTIAFVSIVATSMSPAIAQVGTASRGEEMASEVDCALNPGSQGCAPHMGATSKAASAAGSLEEVVVMGYSTSNVQDISGAVTSVDMASIADAPAANPMKSLQGKVPGVFITTSGNPESQATVRIRGQGLGPLGNNDPLYVIDGVPTTSGMHEINSNDIESIQVLKDASTASIFGARSGNGVIVVTTKKGSQADGLKFDFRLNQSLDTFKYDIRPLSTTQRPQALYQAAINDRVNPNSVSPLYSYNWNGDFNNPILYDIQIGDDNGFISTDPAMRVANTNWFDAVVRDGEATDFNLAVSNGTENSNAYASFGYYKQDGLVDASQFERMSFRVNSDYTLMDGELKFGENAMVTNQVANVVNARAEEILFLSLEQQSIIPIYTEDGGWGGPTAGVTDRDNPVRLIFENKNNEYRFNRIMANAFIEWSPAGVLDGLTLKSVYGINYGQFDLRNFIRSSQAGSINIEDRVINNYNWNKSLVWTNTAQYDFTINDSHHINLLVGTENVDFTTEAVQASGEDLAVQDRNFAFLNNITSSALVSGSGDQWSLVSYFGKVDYNYSDKYLASATIRRDGSSRFGENNKWGDFPAASLGWRISSEPFFNVDFIEELKFRVSWGETGNQEISTIASKGLFVPRPFTQSLFTSQQDEGTAYDLAGANAGNLPSGFARVQAANPDLRWETSTMTNIGFDIFLLDDRFSASLDWYEKRTEDILTVTNPLATLGEGAQRVVNGGSIDNSGFEMVLNYTDDFEIADWGVFNVEANFNISTSKNEVVDLPSEVLNSFGGDGQSNTILGRSINSIFGYVADGLFQSQEEVDAHATQAGAAPGRIRYVDLDGNGVINEQDQKFFTSTDPDYIYGFNVDVRWRQWDFNMFWQGVEGGEVKNDWLRFTHFTSLNAGSNYGNDTLNAWSPDNTGSDIPALSLSDNNAEARESSFFWEDKSYLKLRNLSLSYNFKDSVLSNLNIVGARVYIRGENLITITPSGGRLQDPETPSSVFPIPKRITVGFNASFF